MIIVRAIKPSKPFQSSIFREEVKREADALAKDIKDDFERTTATWHKKPRFKKTVSMGAAVGGVQIEVATTNKIYGYVDEGTKRHWIAPKNKKALAWNTGWSPKTSPNTIMSVAGTSPRKGGKKKDVVVQGFDHPGTKPRNFSKTIHKSYSKEFRQRMQNALDRAARRFNQ